MIAALVSVGFGAVIATIIACTRAGRRSAREQFAALEQIRDGLIQEHDRQKQLDTLRGPDFLKQLERPRRIPTEWAPARHAAEIAPKVARIEPTRVRVRNRRVS